MASIWCDPLKFYVPRPDENQPFKAVGIFTFVLLLVLVLTTPFVDMTSVLTEQQRQYRLYGYGLVALLQLALIGIRGWDRSLRIISMPIVLLLIWSAMSLTWSQHIDLTVKRIGLLALIYTGIFSSFSDLGTRRSLSIIRIVLVVALALNFIVALTLPEIGIHTKRNTLEGLWRGFMGQKNIAGMLCAITVILFTFDASKLPIFNRALIIVLSLVFLFLTWSKTALLTLPFALVVGTLVTLFAKRRTNQTDIPRRYAYYVALGAFGLIMLLLIVATIQREVFLSITNDTTALTTRAAIWRPMIQFYLDHPILGSGYGAYWDGSPSVVDPLARKSYLWKNVDQGHNGYLDLLVQIGIPGLALALYAAFVSPMRTLGPMIANYPQRAGLVAALLVFALIENFSESYLFADDALGNAFLLITLAILHRSSLHHRRKSAIDMTRPGQFREKRQRRSPPVAG